MVKHVGHALLITTDHLNGRLYERRALAIMLASAVEWINNWLANNAPTCPDQYVCMIGGGEGLVGKSCEVHRTFTNNCGYSIKLLTGRDMSHQNGPGGRPCQTSPMPFERCCLERICSPAASGRVPPFTSYLRRYNFVTHAGSDQEPASPLEMCGSDLPNL
jgi:hypothetical protein